MHYHYSPRRRGEMPPKDSHMIARLPTPGKGEELGTDRATCPRPPNKYVNKSDRGFLLGSRNRTLAT